jgi:hypothetical protein
VALRAIPARREPAPPGGAGAEVAMCRRPPRTMTPAERERFQGWWLDESGPSLAELRQIAVGLGVVEELRASVVEAATNPEAPPRHHQHRI